MAAISTFVAIRSGVTSDDSGIPSTAQGLADCTGYKHILMDCVVSAASGGMAAWTVTPLFWNSVAGAYVAGQAVVVSGNTRLVVAVDGTPDFYVKVDGSSGDTPTISVYVGPSMQ